MTSRRRLPRPLAVEWEWQQRAACREAASAVFFHPELERGAAKRRRVERAKAVCQRCPVIMECRRQSIRLEEPYGVWGGLDEAERRQAIARRRRHTRHARSAH